MTTISQIPYLSYSYTFVNFKLICTKNVVYMPYISFNLFYDILNLFQRWKCKNNYVKKKKAYLLVVVKKHTKFKEYIVRKTKQKQTRHLVHQPRSVYLKKPDKTYCSKQFYVSES